MSSTVAVIVAAAALLVVVAFLLVRGRRDQIRPEHGPAPERSGSESSRVRVLPTDRDARDARVEALRTEITALDREIRQARNDDLDRRAQRLVEIREERQAELGALRPHSSSQTSSP